MPIHHAGTGLGWPSTRPPPATDPSRWPSAARSTWPLASGSRIGYGGR